MCFQNGNIYELLLQSSFFQPLSKKCLIIAESGLFSLRKVDSGNCENSWRGVGGISANFKWESLRILNYRFL